MGGNKAQTTGFQGILNLGEPKDERNELKGGPKGGKIEG